MIARTYNQVAAELARVAGAAGMRVDDTRLLDRINLAQEKLANEGDWVGTVQRIRICVYDEFVALPHEFEAALALSLDRVTVPILDPWFEFIDSGAGQQDVNPSYVAAHERGTAPVIRQPCGKRLRIYSFGDERVNGVRPKIRLSGVNPDGDVIRTEVSPGVFEDGLLVELAGDSATPYVTTTEDVQIITGAVKPATRYPVEIRYVDDDEVEYFGARYAHWITNPTFRLYYVPGVLATGSVLHALVRRRFLPVRADSLDTPMFITNLPALRKAVMSIAKEEANELQASETLLASAVRDLKKEKETHERSLRPPVNVPRISGFEVADVV